MAQTQGVTDLATRTAALEAGYDASKLNTGTVPDGRFPATLPAASGVNLTALNASNLGSGTVPDARLSANVQLRDAAVSVASTSEPADSAVSTGQALQWSDTTNGAPAVRVKGKSADGTVWVGVLAGYAPELVPACALMFDRRRGLYQDAARATAASANSDPVGGVLGRVNTASQSTTARKMTLDTTDGLKGNGGSGGVGGSDWKRLTLGASVVLAGDFEAYFVVKRSATGKIVVPLGGTGGTGLLLYSDNTIYISDAGTAASVAYTGTASGVLLWHFRRSGSTCYFEGTSMAEATVSGGGTPGAITLTTVNGRGDGVASDATEFLRQFAVYDRVLTAAERAAVVAWLTAVEGVTL